MTRQFRLPMTLSHLVTHAGGSWTAHSLDFDIVEFGSNEKEAWDNLMLAVKTYIEFGLSKGWDDFIIQPAPEEIQQQITPETQIQMMPPLEIASMKRSVIAMRPHDSQRVA